MQKARKLSLTKCSMSGFFSKLNLKTNHLKIWKVHTGLFGCSDWEYFLCSTLWGNNQVFHCSSGIFSFRMICGYVVLLLWHIIVYKKKANIQNLLDTGGQIGWEQCNWCFQNEEIFCGTRRTKFQCLIIWEKLIWAWF